MSHKQNALWLVGASIFLYSPLIWIAQPNIDLWLVVLSANYYFTLDQSNARGLLFVITTSTPKSNHLIGLAEPNTDLYLFVKLNEQKHFPFWISSANLISERLVVILSIV